MKKIIKYFALSLACVGLTACEQEFAPQSGTVDVYQAGNAPGSYSNFVAAITGNLTGKFTYGGTSNTYPFDYGYTSFYIQRDVMGQDMVTAYSGSWYNTWYGCGTSLAPTYAWCQLPLTYYYKWIKACNEVLTMAGDEPDALKKTGAGIAHLMRALYYLEIAQMYSERTYTLDPEAETVPIVTEKTTVAMGQNNPRATNKDMFEFIISDLDKAETLLADFQRDDVYTPDKTVAYGLKARAYLVMGEWANAEKYAKLAQNGYSIMSNDEYTDRNTGFNTPNGAWMFATKFVGDDPAIKLNDADSSWGSIMSLECNGSGCGYASSYGHQITIDRHLYETMPATDIRKKCFVDFAINDMSGQEKIDALSAYSDYPQWLIQTEQGNSDRPGVGGFSLKFRVAGGVEGHNNQYIGFLQSVPIMRVEEMVLIEAEAAGMQNEARGISLLTAFAQLRDPEYVYGTHDESYYNHSTSKFQNECWWQRRVELWGEGLATLDIKRLNKGIIRSYPNTNHLETYRWNVETVPQWMTLCFVQTESNYNNALNNNPTPIKPSGDSPEFSF